MSGLLLFYFFILNSALQFTNCSSCNSQSWLSVFQPPLCSLADTKYTNEVIETYTLKLENILKMDTTGLEEMTLLKQLYEYVLKENKSFPLVCASNDECNLINNDIPLYTVVISTSFLTFLADKLASGVYNNLWGYYTDSATGSYTILKSGMVYPESLKNSSYSIISPFTLLIDAIFVSTQYNLAGLDNNNSNNIWPTNNSNVLSRKKCNEKIPLEANLFSAVNELPVMEKVSTAPKLTLTDNLSTHTSGTTTNFANDLEFVDIGYFTRTNERKLGNTGNSLISHSEAIFYSKKEDYNNSESAVENKNQDYVKISYSLNAETCPRLLISVARNPDSEPNFIFSSFSSYTGYDSVSCSSLGTTCGTSPILIAQTENEKLKYTKLQSVSKRVDLVKENVYLSNLSPEVLFEVETSVFETNYDIYLSPLNFIPLSPNLNGSGTCTWSEEEEYYFLPSSVKNKREIPNITSENTIFSNSYIISALCASSLESEHLEFSNTPTHTDIIFANRNNKVGKIGGSEYSNTLVTTSISKRSINKILQIASDTNYSAKTYANILKDGALLIFNSFTKKLNIIDMTPTNTEMETQKSIATRCFVYVLFSALLFISTILAQSIKCCRIYASSKEINNELSNTSYFTAIMKFAKICETDSPMIGLERKTLLNQKAAEEAEEVLWDTMNSKLHVKIKLFIKSVGLLTNSAEKKKKKIVTKKRLKNMGASTKKIAFNAAIPATSVFSNSSQSLSSSKLKNIPLISKLN